VGVFFLKHGVRVPSLVLIARAVFLLEHGQTNKQTDQQTDVSECPNHAGGYAGMGNKQTLKM